MEEQVIERDEIIKNNIYPLNADEKSKVALAITEFRDRIVAKYLTD